MFFRVRRLSVAYSPLPAGIREGVWSSAWRGVTRIHIAGGGVW